MQLLTVGYAGDDAPDGALDAREDAVFVAAGWTFTALVSPREKSLRVLGGVGVVDSAGRVIVNDAFARARACACATDAVFVVTSRGLGHFYVDGERDAETWREYDGADAVVAADVDGDGRFMALDDRGRVLDADGAEVFAPSVFSGVAVRRIALGGKHGVFVTKNAEAWTFGWNLYGQCGLGVSSNDVPSPTAVRSFSAVGVRISDASCGDAFTIFVADGGDLGASLYACGTNRDGQLGTEDCEIGVSTATPRLVALENAPSMVRCGARHCAAACADGVYLWGANDQGQCGAAAADAVVPRPRRFERVDLASNRVVALACGASHVAILVAAESPPQSPDDK